MILSRRAALAGGVSLAARALGPALAAAAPPSLRIDDDKPGEAISPGVYGCNEIGAIDGGGLSVERDHAAGVAARRLGGDLMTGYNWVNNATHAGKDYRHANGAYLLDALRLQPEARARPLAVVEAMHEASLSIGATSLVTLPLAGYVAADFAGPVAESEAAPSLRFRPIRWDGAARADDPVDPTTIDVLQGLRRLVARYGGAGSSRGIRAYALDNEPAIWAETHPRLVREHPTIAGHIARSILAARAIKAIDAVAEVFGPASWGPTEMVSFQNAPDWPDYRRYGSFLAAYLDAFREASERDGGRLLDALDVHWYAFHGKRGLMRSEDPALDAALLDAPRTLSETGFREESWVSRALPVGGEGLALPILPSLQGLIRRWFPGTKLAIGEFNYGGAGRLAAGLALADALGRFGAEGVGAAYHWGSLAGWLGEAYRLYRLGGVTPAFGARTLAVALAAGPELAAYASRAGEAVSLIVVNKGERAASLDVGFARGARRPAESAFGFDAAHPAAVDLPAAAETAEGATRLVLPPRAARRYAFT